MADLTPYEIAIGDSSYPIIFNDLLEHLTTYLAEIESARAPSINLSAGIDARILDARFAATFPSQPGYEGLEYTNDGTETMFGASAHGSLSIINFCNMNGV
jgi:hypothetical protein